MSSRSLVAVAILAGLSFSGRAQAQAHIETARQTVAFEDAANGGDQDRNDVVVITKRQCITNGAGELVRTIDHVTGVAAGAGRDAELWLELPSPTDSVERCADAAACDGGGATLTPNGSEQVQIVGSFRDLFISPPTSGWINTNPGQSAFTAGLQWRIETDYTAGSELNIGAGPCPDPDYMIDGFSGVIDDTSVALDGSPLMARFPGDWAVPQEKVSITTAYPLFDDWVANPGDHLFWYLTVNDTEVHDRTGSVPVVDDFETCNDGVQNGDETGVDCGDSLEVCPLCPGTECDSNNGGCGDPTYYSCTNDLQGPICADIDECQTNNGDCGDPTYYACTNNDGADPTCADIDECLTNNGGCPVDNLCTNNTGAPATCSCLSDYADVRGDGSICVSMLTQVAAGEYHTCSVVGGGISCWGAEGVGHEYGQVSGPNGDGGSSWVQVVSGSTFTCALRSNGTIGCWGNDAYGRVSGPNAGGGGFVQLSSGNSHICGLRDDGTQKCWGYNYNSQVTGPNNYGGSTWRQVAAGGSQTCNLHTNNTIRCWGNDFYGQVTAANSDGGSDFAQIESGNGSICGLTHNGGLSCWGNDSVGQLTGPNSGGTDFIQFAGGEATENSQNHTCGLRSNGRIQCWGLDSYGQVSGPNADTSTDFVEIVTGYYHTCGLRTNDTITCWGRDTDGQVSGP